MACSTTNHLGNSNTVDIEDIYGKNKGFSQIDQITDENIATYKTVMRILYDWVQENKRRSDIKQRFSKRFSAISREYNQIHLKKSLLVYLYRKMVEAEEIPNSFDFWRLIQKNPSRNISGITSVTVLTSPFPDGQKYSWPSPSILSLSL